MQFRHRCCFLPYRVRVSRACEQSIKGGSLSIPGKISFMIDFLRTLPFYASNVAAITTTPHTHT